MNRNQRGHALPLALGAAALLIPLAALAVFQARTGLLVQQNLRGEAEAFAAADASLEWATAALGPETAPSLLLAGPDGAAGTADDGRFPAGGAPAAARRAEVRVYAAGEGLFRLTAAGSGSRGASKVLERLVRRAALPYSPAAAYATGAVVPELAGGGFALSGFDHVAGDAIGTPTGSSAALPAIAYDSEAAEAAVRAALEPGAAGRLAGAGGSPSMASARPPGVLALAERAASFGAVRYPGGAILEALALGAAGAPQITIIDGDALASGASSGNGVLVVRGSLRVAGDFDYAGIVVALAGMIVEAGATARIHGGLWLGAPPLRAQGGGGIAACAACLAGVDAAFPELLPHLYEARGWREAP